MLPRRRQRLVVVRRRVHLDLAGREDVEVLCAVVTWKYVAVLP